MADILQEKSYNFALRIVKLSEYLNDEKREYVLSKKILDSGTNIGLLIEEGKQGESRSDFIQNIQSLTKKHLNRISFCGSFEIPNSFQPHKRIRCFPIAGNCRGF